MNFKVNVSELLRLSQNITKTSEDILRRVNRMRDAVKEVPNSWDDSASDTYTDKYDTFLIQLSNLAVQYRNIGYIIKRTVDDYQQCDDNSSYIIAPRSFSEIQYIGDEDDDDFDYVEADGSYKTIGGEIAEVSDVSSDYYTEVDDSFEYVDSGKKIKKVKKGTDSYDTLLQEATLDYEDGDEVVAVKNNFSVSSNDYAGAEGTLKNVDEDVVEVEDVYDNVYDGYVEAEGTLENVGSDEVVAVKNVESDDDFYDFSKLNSDDDVWNLNSFSSGDIEWEDD